MSRKIREIVVSDGYRHVLHDEINPDIPLALDFCGTEECEPGHSFGPVEREANIIHIVTEGKGILRCFGQEWKIEAGSMFVIPVGQLIYYKADNNDPWTYYWIGFHGSSAEENIRRIGFRRDRPVLTVTEPDEIVALIEKMMRYRELNHIDYMMRTGILYQILSLMMSDARFQGKYIADCESVSSYAEYAIRYIRMHFRENLRITELAEKIGISRGYLVRIFREATSMSPKAYLMHTRLWYSVHNLAHTNDSVNEVALQSGYSDALAYSKTFKTHFGMSPSQFRTLYQQKKISEEDMLNAYQPARKNIKTNSLYL